MNRPWIVVIISNDGSQIRYLGQGGSLTSYRLLARTFPDAHEARLVGQIWSRFPLFEIGGAGDWSVEPK